MLELRVPARCLCICVTPTTGGRPSSATARDTTFPMTTLTGGLNSATDRSKWTDGATTIHLHTASNVRSQNECDPRMVPRRLPMIVGDLVFGFLVSRGDVC